jgi:RNA polymerase sigma factor (sigma-70 family)
MTDEELGLAAAANQAGAFDELYARYADPVFARITRMVGPCADREDVLQQVFLQLHTALPRFRGESKLSTYLYRIVNNVVYDHLRHRMRRPGVHDPAALDELVDGEQTPEDRARRREKLRQIFELLDLLKPKKRIAFVLVAIEGLSLVEAAALLAVEYDTVKQRVRQARLELVALTGGTSPTYHEPTT